MLRRIFGTDFNLVLTCVTVTTLENRVWTTRMIWLAAQHDWISSWCTVLTQVWSLSPLLYCITNLNISSTCSSKQASEAEGLADSSEKHLTKLEVFVGDWQWVTSNIWIGSLVNTSVKTDPYLFQNLSWDYICRLCLRFFIFLFSP